MNESKKGRGKKKEVEYIAKSATIHHCEEQMDVYQVWFK
jgi:hypothetical protein